MDRVPRWEVEGGEEETKKKRGGSASASVLARERFASNIYLSFLKRAFPQFPQFPPESLRCHGFGLSVATPVYISHAWQNRIKYALHMATCAVQDLIM